MNYVNKMTNNKINLIIGCMSFVVALTGCASAGPDSYEKADIGTSFTISDLDTIYEDEEEEKVIYLTVGRKIDPLPSNDVYKWEDVNYHEISWYEENGVKQYECDALVQFGNEEGPTSGNFGYGDVAPNATVRLSGKKASTKPQKSYRIKIKSGSGSVSGMKSFVLSKSFGDPLRFTNKLCFELIREIDNMLSVRTQFIHLYVRDETEDDNALFVDYGLYTMIEPVNKKYLKNRNLDESGELYKAVDFDFERHEDVIMDPTEERFDKERFEEILEAKGSNDYSKLINMLEELDKKPDDINSFVERYFDEDNLYTWMAFNILTDNKDTDTENFYLYSPTGAEKFYIIPWDFDGAFRYEYEKLRDENYSPGWQKGIYIYTDSKLFGCMVRDEKCINKLSERIAALHETVLSGENVYSEAKKLSMTVKPHLYSLPDMTFARVTNANYDILIDHLKIQADENYYAYYDSLETPSPFHIHKPVNKNGEVVISWDESNLLEGDLKYSVELSDSWDFEKKIKNETNISDTMLNIGKLPEGQYFVRVKANAENGLTQEAYEYYNTEKKTTVHGVMCFYVKEDGTAIQSLFDSEEEEQ